MQRKLDGSVPRVNNPGESNFLKLSAKVYNEMVKGLIGNNDIQLSSNKFKNMLAVKARTYCDNDGHLPLHAFCGLSLENSDLEIKLLASLLDLYPRAVTQKDSKGNLPLHIAVQRPDCNVMVIRHILEKNPKTANVINGEGSLPLFIACRNPTIDPEVLEELLLAYPEAAQKVVYGCLALHQLAYCGNPILASISYLLESNPNAAKTANSHGNLPLHLLCGRPDPYVTLENVRALVEAYPKGLSQPNKAGQTPIDKLLRKVGNESFHPALARFVLRAAPSATLGTEERTILKNLNWNARRDAVLVSVKYSEGRENSTMPYLYAAYSGVWREIVTYL